MIADLPALKPPCPSSDLFIQKVNGCTDAVASYNIQSNDLYLRVTEGQPRLNFSPSTSSRTLVELGKVKAKLSAHFFLDALIRDELHVVPLRAVHLEIAELLTWSGWSVAAYNG